MREDSNSSNEINFNNNNKKKIELEGNFEVQIEPYIIDLFGNDSDLIMQPKTKKKSNRENKSDTITEIDTNGKFAIRMDDNSNTYEGDSYSADPNPKDKEELYDDHESAVLEDTEEQIKSNQNNNRIHRDSIQSNTELLNSSQMRAITQHISSSKSQKEINNQAHLSSIGQAIKENSNHERFLFEEDSRKKDHASKSLCYVLRYNVYELHDGTRKQFADKVIRERLLIISNYLESLQQKKAGTSKFMQNIVSLVGWGALSSISIVNKYMLDKLCPEKLGESDQKKCEESLKTLCYTSLAYSGLCFVAFVSNKYSRHWKNNINLHKDLYEQFDLKEREINDINIANEVFLSKKLQFIKYIQLKFWEELCIRNDSNIDPLKFLKSIPPADVARANLTIMIGALQFFIDFQNIV